MSLWRPRQLTAGFWGWIQVVGMSVDVGRFILSEEVGREQA